MCTELLQDGSHTQMSPLHGFIRQCPRQGGCVCSASIFRLLPHVCTHTHVTRTSTYVRTPHTCIHTRTCTHTSHKDPHSTYTCTRTCTYTHTMKLYIIYIGLDNDSCVSNMLTHEGFANLSPILITL